MCDRNSGYIHLVDGEVLEYNSHHQMVSWIGRYETAEDGTVRIYRYPWSDHQNTEYFYATVEPRLLGFRISSQDDSSWSWRLRRPEVIRNVFKNAEIRHYYMGANSHREIFYDYRFKVLRKETRPRRKKTSSP